MTFLKRCVGVVGAAAVSLLVAGCGASAGDSSGGDAVGGGGVPAYCELLAAAQSVEYPMVGDTSDAAEQARLSYFALVTEAADRAEQVGRLDVAVFLSLAVEVNRGGDTVTAEMVERLSQLEPQAQRVIDEDCVALSQ